MSRRFVPDGDAARIVLRFAAAVAVGAAGGAAFVAIRAPLPWVLGSMAACALASIAGLPVAAGAATRRPMAAVIGVVLGCSFHPGLWQTAREWWLPLAMLPVFLGIAALACVAWFRRVAGFDPATAYFAGMPGGIAEMVLMGGERGADERTVGLIHAARIFLVVFTLPFVIRHVHAPAAVPATPVTAASAWPDVSLLLWGGGSMIVGLLIGRALRLPAWHLMGPLAVSATLHATGITDFRVPGWLLAAAQVGLGATIGCRFGGLTLRAFVRILALAAGSTLILLALTFAFALILGRATGLDPALLALAYSPGGLAEMSMVALSLALEPGVVIVHHLARVVIVLVAAPFAFRPTREEPTS
ncbi:AbrB family transcriptional regulator [Microvirga sp. SRT01]|uniref:AbrB family transcriptional regulator n=1 Tax=Sphingomonas longa TaxID=2778730 RepID=A0ABS2D305_9SPHN|nr:MULTISPECIES: AbrB family transcriptional regulator [Alphaproteobacteria]MBM6575305.1 AbrB family transcriptional regulator [Sphingomonas sp. BT552]MBR7708355.1 AbrB family transcriptional regulator [Microvirga sp. SRT01]